MRYLDLRGLPPDHSCSICREGLPQPRGSARCRLIAALDSYLDAARTQLRRFRLWEGERAFLALVAEHDALSDSLAKSGGKVRGKWPARKAIYAQAILDERARIEPLSWAAPETP